MNGWVIGAFWGGAALMRYAWACFFFQKLWPGYRGLVEALGWPVVMPVGLWLRIRFERRAREVELEAARRAHEAWRLDEEHARALAARQVYLCSMPGCRVVVRQGDGMGLATSGCWARICDGCADHLGLHDAIAAGPVVRYLPAEQEQEEE